MMKSKVKINESLKEENRKELRNLRDWAKIQFNSWTKLGGNPIIMKVA